MSERPMCGAEVLPKQALTVPDTSAGSITRTVMTWGVPPPMDFGRKAGIFPKLTREDWLHIVDVCDKSLEKYYMRFKK